jgi:sedoheptulokinase
MSRGSAEELFLGIDIGTSKTAAVVTGTGGKVHAVALVPHQADLPSSPGHSEQDVHRLLESAWSAVRRLSRSLRRQTRGIGVTGQMHGVVVLARNNAPLTPLVTWQDNRCLESQFLEKLNEGLEAPLRSGYGCATLAWYFARHRLPEGSAAASTIADLAVANLCGLFSPVADPTNAASWGLFDVNASSWDYGAAASIGIAAELLPRVVPCGHPVGSLSGRYAELLGVPAAVPVIAATGDNQASIIGALPEPETELSLTLGTGGQLSAVLSDCTGKRGLPSVPTVEYRPYPGNRLVAVASVLSGGSAWRWLATAAQEWTRALGLARLPLQRIYAAMNESGLASSAGGLVIRPSFLGERHDTRLRGTVQGIDSTNFSLGSVARALAIGICVNLRDMLPSELRAGRHKVVGSGNGIAKNPLIVEVAAQVFGLPVVVSTVTEAAAVGAALNAAQSIMKNH